MKVLDHRLASFSCLLTALTIGLTGYNALSIAQPSTYSSASGSNVSQPFGGIRQPAEAAAPTANGPAAASELAAKLTNPVADLISVPFQFNWNGGLGLDRKGSGFDMVVQPVVPLKLNSNWNYIVRPVVTLGVQNNVNGYSGSGAGPVLVETFLSPKTDSKFVWGVGPVVSTPALSGNRWGTAQTGAGVTAVGLYMNKPWTVGLLAYQTWDVGGSPEAGTANNTYWQPFLAYVTSNAWTFSLNTQSSFNWDSRRSQNPLNFSVSKLTHWGKLPVSLELGGRYFLSSVPGGASGWGVRAQITFLLPE